MVINIKTWKRSKDKMMVKKVIYVIHNIKKTKVKLNSIYKIKTRIGPLKKKKKIIIIIITEEKYKC